MEVFKRNNLRYLEKFNYAIYTFSYIALINEMTIKNKWIMVIMYLSIPFILILNSRRIIFLEIVEEYKIRKIAYLDYFIKITAWLCIINSTRFFNKKVWLIVLIFISFICYILNIFFEKKINKTLKDNNITDIDIDDDYIELAENVEYKEARQKYNQIKMCKLKLIMLGILGISIIISKSKSLSDLNQEHIYIYYLLSAFIMVKYYYETILFYKNHKMKQLYINIILSIIGYIIVLLFFKKCDFISCIVIYSIFNYRLDNASRKLLIIKGRVLYKVIKYNLSIKSGEFMSF